MECSLISRTAVVVIFYNPSDIQKRVFKKLSERMMVVAVDNSATALTTEEIGGCIYTPLYGNKGIAAAQNIGIKKSIEKGAEILVFFDQDSDVTSQLIKDLVLSFEKKRAVDKMVAAIGPTLVDKRTNVRYKTGGKKGKGEFVISSSLISSGTTTSIDVLNKVGGMDEKLFIDYVDFEWCWRANSKGYHVYRSERVVLPHEVGTKNTSYLGFPVIISSPARYYYKYRNTFLLAKRKYVPTSWKIKTMFRQVFTLFHILASSNYKGRRTEFLSNALRGTKEGLSFFLLNKYEEETSFSAEIFC